MDKYRIVIDTNVVISAVRYRRGTSYALMRQILRDDLEFVLSVPLVIEYEKVAIVQQDSAVAVVRVFAEADIGGDEEAGLGCFYCARRFLDDTVRGVAARTAGILGGGDAEEKHRTDSKTDDFVYFGFQLVYR